MAVSFWRSLARMFRRPVRPSHAATRARRRTRDDRSTLCDRLEPRQLLATTVVFSDGFEGTSPTLSGWTLRTYSGGSSAPKWGPSTVKEYNGSRSAFVAGSLGPTRNTYAVNQHTAIRREHLSLKGFGTASLSFKYFLNTEAAYDVLSVNVIDNESGATKTVFRDSGDDRSADWQAKTLSLSAFAGRGDLSVEFRFDSDGTVVRDAPSGAWVDDVRLVGDTRPSTATIRGSLFEDADGDRVRDAGEKPLNGWTVYLDRNQNRRRDSGEASRVTDTAGRYAFTGLAPGTYYVAAEPRSGFTQTSPTLAEVRTPREFDVALHFDGSGLTSAQRDAFAAAARRWERVIVGDLPDVEDDGETIDDMWIEAAATEIDGAGGVLAQASPSAMRDPSLGGGAASKPGRSGLPYRGFLEIDRDDLRALERNGTLVDVITHEMGHALGFGTLWEENNLVRNAGSDDPRYTGAVAVAQYDAVFDSFASSVPLENEGGPGTQDSHWRESAFGGELMTGYVDRPPNRLSAVTVGSMADLGYVVDLSAADGYVPPGGHPVNAAPGVERAVTVTAGQTRSAVDFGYRRTAAPPSVGALTDTPDPASAGATVTLRAANVAAPGGSVARVGFYRETNGRSGLQFGTGGDLLLGTDSTATGGAYTVSFSTASLAPGTYTYYAVAVANGGTSGPGGTAAASTKNTVRPAAPGRISGTVYLDADADGTRDASEGPAAGATVYVDANGNERLDTGERRAVSDSAGNYALADLAAGTYNIRVVPPAGMIRTVPSAGKHTVQLAAGATVTGKTFAVAPAASITGRVFGDTDADGAKDSDEVGLGAWRVFFDADDDGVWDSNEQWTETGSNGTYTLGNLRPGRYTVRAVLKSGYRVTRPTTGSYKPTLAAGQKLSGLNFGVVRR